MKWLKITLVIVLVGGGGYYFLTQHKVSKITIPHIDWGTAGTFLKKTGSVVAAKSSVLAVGAKDLVVATAETVTDQVTETFKKLIDDKVNDAKQKLVTSVSNSIGLQPAAGQANFVNVAIKVGERAYFTIYNTQSSERVTYAVDWQDGAQGNGSIEKDQSIFVSHSWTKAGNYEIHFKVTNSKKTEDYKVLVSIFNG